MSFPRYSPFFLGGGVLPLFKEYVQCILILPTRLCLGEKKALHEKKYMMLATKPIKKLLKPNLSISTCSYLYIVLLINRSISTCSYQSIYLHTNIIFRRCPWCNSYRRRKWTRWHEFKSWTRLIAFHIALIPLGKVWIQLFSLQQWVK